jgi:hypothetical protein
LPLQFIVLFWSEPRLSLIGHQLGLVETGPAGSDDGATEPPFLKRRYVRGSAMPVRSRLAHVASSG